VCRRSEEEPRRGEDDGGERRAWRGARWCWGSVGCGAEARGFVFLSREAVLISEEELMDVMALQRQGLSYAEIGRLLGRDWRTVKRYVEHGAQPVYRRRRAPSKLDEFKPLIDQWLAGEPRLLSTRIHQDLVRDYGFKGGYDTVRRYVERARPRREQKVEKRFETAAGHQAQIDWSHEQPIRTTSGLELALYCFHMVLGHSRDSFCALTGSQDLVTFWACHRAAFAHFGGVPRELLYDRTKTVVRSHVGREVAVGERVALLGAPGEMHEVNDTASVGSREPIRRHDQNDHRLSLWAALALSEIPIESCSRNSGACPQVKLRR
jgi:Integrase core domain